MSKQRSRDTEPTSPLPITVVTVASLAYAIFHRSLLDFMVGTVPILAAFLVILIPIAIMDWRRDHKEPFAQKIGATFLATSLASLFLYVIGVAIKDAWLWLLLLPYDSKAKLIGNRIIVGVGTLALGTMLFWLRLHVRAIYGATEVVVAVVIALAQTRQQSLSNVASNPQIALALLTASVYLVVRGFDNIHHGIYKSPPDYLARKFMRWALPGYFIRDSVVADRNRSKRASEAAD